MILHRIRSARTRRGERELQSMRRATFTPRRSRSGTSRNTRSGEPADLTVLSFLRLEVLVVGFDKGLDIVGHTEKSEPLFLVEGHGESAHPINREGTFLTDFHRELAATALLQGFILRAQALEFCLDIIGHGTSQPFGDQR